VKTKNTGMKRGTNRHQVQSHDAASRQERSYEKAERQEAKRLAVVELDALRYRLWLNLEHARTSFENLNLEAP
jgi:hypothetical protein